MPSEELPPFEAATSWEELKKRLKDRYEDYDEGLLLTSQITSYEYLYGTIFSIKGQRVLDLGCGSKNGEGEIYHRFRPWLCRVLHEVGARPVGVDIEQNDDESFEHYTKDLTDERSLALFEDASFHVVNNHGFLPPLYSPRYLECTSPALLEMIGKSRLEMFQNFLLSEATRLLQDGGYYVCHDTLRVKEDGHLCDKGKIRDYLANAPSDIHNLEILFNRAIFNLKPGD